MRLTRRWIFSLIPLAALPRRAQALSPAATVTAASGGGSATLPDGSILPLAEGLALPAGARLQTAPGGRAGLTLEDGTLVNAGTDTWVELVADAAGETGARSLNLSGVAVVDRRAAGAAPGVMTVSTEGFDVMLEGARVYLASLEGGKVLVKEGEAYVTAPAARIVLAAGEAVELAPMPAFAPAPAPPPPPAPGAAPEPAAPAPPAAAPPTRGGGPAGGSAEVYRWSEDEMEAAFDSVGLTA